jgi:gamma-glutamylcyclotransferase (GGCT)/AIG2-like uncharacterized protein YtfP
VLYDTGLGYPAMVTDKVKRVYGEVYEVNVEQLQRLDCLEGYKGEEMLNLYDRTTQTVYTDNDAIEAFVYVYSTSQATDLKEIQFGDWKCHQYLPQDHLLYFAYGSCMDNERFNQAGVGHLFTKVKGCGKAKNYSLAYTRRSHDGGRADMVESKQWVEGKVYEIQKEALNYLYGREGVNTSIYRPAFISIEINSVLHKNVLTFLVIEKEQEIAPPEYYATEIIRGAKDTVSDTYFQRLIDNLNKKFNMKLTI